MGKNKHKGGSVLPLLLLGSAAVAAGLTLSEKAGALQRVSENWEVSGFKVIRFQGLSAVLEVELTFYNTSRRAAVLDALTMTAKYRGGVIGVVRLPAKATIAPQGSTKIKAEVVAPLATLAAKALSVVGITALIAQMKGKPLADQVKLFQQKLGLKGVQFEGDIVVAGFQKHFSFVTDLGNVSAPVKPQLTPAADKVNTTASQTA